MTPSAALQADIAHRRKFASDMREIEGEREEYQSGQREQDQRDQREEAMTNEAKHTPEPWYADGDTIYKDIGDKRHSIADCHHWAEETEPNARRIVACVNAAEGISTEALEACKDIAAAGIATVRSVEEQRDELAEQLASVLAAVGHMRAAIAPTTEKAYFPGLQGIIDSARATLAKL